MKERFTIGVITKPHGVKGELKVTPFSGDYSRFNKLKKIFIDDMEFSVLGAKPCGEFIALSILGVSDRNLAETFRGKNIEILREDALDLKENEYYIEDIIGCDLVTDEPKIIGKIVDVFSAKTDVFTVKTVSGKTMRFPFLKDVLISVDVQLGEVKVKKSRLMEICCYED